MKKVTKIFIFTIFLLVFSVAVRAQNSWVGSYEFNEDGGKTAGGTAIFIVHQIDILESDDGLIALVQSNGFQTSRDLVGTTKIEGDKLLVYLESYGENNIFENYKKGDLLFTLQQKTEKGKTQIMTFWNKFQPVVPKNEKSGKVYFQKIKTLE